MGAVLGLSAAVIFGVSDFVGGLAARRLHFLWVALIGQGIGACLVWATLLWTAPGEPSTSTLFWGALSGLGTAVGTVALYRGYASGQMAVAGPLSAVGSAALPAVVGALLGDRLSPVGVAGVVLAMPALWLVASTPQTGGAKVRAGVVDGLVSGAGFALLFIGLDQAGDADGMWPVAAGEGLSAALLALLCLVVRPARPARAPQPVAVAGPGARSAGRLAVAAGVLGVTATILFFYATHAGLLTVAAVLTSLYPGVTVLLAAVVLHERPDRTQLVGLALCAAAVAAIVAS